MFGTAGAHRVLALSSFAERKVLSWPNNLQFCVYGIMKMDGWYLLADLGQIAGIHFHREGIGKDHD